MINMSEIGSNRSSILVNRSGIGVWGSRIVYIRSKISLANWRIVNIEFWITCDWLSVGSTDQRSVKMSGISGSGDQYFNELGETLCSDGQF